jgi:hypothetical protein
MYHILFSKLTGSTDYDWAMKVKNFPKHLEWKVVTNQIISTVNKEQRQYIQSNYYWYFNDACIAQVYNILNELKVLYAIDPVMSIEYPFDNVIKETTSKEVTISKRPKSRADNITALSDAKQYIKILEDTIYNYNKSTELILPKHELLLLCPICGHNCVHQSEITIYQRKQEDALIVKTVANSAITTIEISDEAHGRRDSLEIDFWCECSCYFTVLILQHKGETYIDVINIVDGADAPEDD